MPKKEPKLVQRENGYWYLAVPVPGAKRPKFKSLDTRDEDEAIRLKGEFIYTGQIKGVKLQNSGDMTCTECLDFYMNDKINPRIQNRLNKVRGAKKTYTPSASFEAMNRNLKAYFGPKNPNDLVAGDGTAYEKLRTNGEIGKRKVTLGTIRRELVHLRTAVNHCIRQGGSWRERGLVARQLDMPGKPVGRSRWFRKDEVKTIFNEADRKALFGGEPEQAVADYIRVIYAWGSRAGVIEKLCCAQIDWDEMVVNQTHPDDQGDAQTCKHKPVVPIEHEDMPDVVHIIRRRYDAAQKAARARGENPRLAPLWPRKNEKHRPEYWGYKRLVDRLGFNPEGEERVCVHTLRHSRATHWLRDGMPVEDVAQLLGDTTDEIEETYGHSCTVSMKKALKKVSGSL